MTELKDVLSHYGIKGMHWGVRRSVGSDGLVEKSESEKKASKSGSGDSSSSSSGESSADHTRAAQALAKANEKGQHSLSNEELSQLTKRLQAEKQFVQLTRDQKSALQKQVDQMNLEKQYRQLKSEEAQRQKSTGRQVIDQLVKTTKDSAIQELGQKGGVELANQLLKQFGIDSAKPSKSAKIPNPFKKSSSESSSKSSKTTYPFKANPESIKIGNHTLPKLLKGK